MKTVASLTMTALLVLAVTAYTADDPIVQKDKHASFEGKLVCLGCDLKKTEGARAACSVYGHKHTLKTEDGKYINFLENDFSKDLIKGEKYHDKDIEIHGVYHDKANVFDVETFAVDGKKMGWCDRCKSMDTCPVSGAGKI